MLSFLFPLQSPFSAPSFCVPLTILRPPFPSLPLPSLPLSVLEVVSLNTASKLPREICGGAIAEIEFGAFSLKI